MGTPDFAIPSLRVLVDAGYDVVAVVTAPDRPAGRGRKLRPSPVKQFALERGLQVLQPEKLRNPDFLAELEALQPDLAVVVAFRMLPKVVWDLPRIGTLNLHGSLLPDYRGAAPINWVLINGESETGVTTFMIDEKIDTGALLLQRKIAIPEDWTAGDLHDSMMEVGAELVLETVQRLEAGDIEAQPQDHSRSIHKAPKLDSALGQIDWTQSGRTVYNKIRGLSPYPAARTRLNGKGLKLFRSQIVPMERVAAPGTAIAEENRLYVRAADSWLEITELQLEGKKRMDTATFLRGYKETITHVE